MKPYQCLNCRHLGRCKDTDLQKVKTEYHCDQWDAAEPEIITARNHIIRLYGEEGIKSITNTEMPELKNG